MKECMLDLETWGKKAGCAVRSIGAVVFDRNSDAVGEKFYRNIEDRSCWMAGLRLEASTVRWWDDQGDAARKVLEVDQCSLGEVAREFNSWFIKLGLQKVWCQGMNFDEPIWETAARTVGQKTPWQYWAPRDTRTAYDLAGLDPKSIPFVGIKHYALDDCLHQIKCLQESCRRLAPPQQEAA